MVALRWEQHRLPQQAELVPLGRVAVAWPLRLGEHAVSPLIVGFVLRSVVRVLGRQLSWPVPVLNHRARLPFVHAVQVGEMLAE